MFNATFLNVYVILFNLIYLIYKMISDKVNIRKFVVR